MTGEALKVAKNSTKDHNATLILSTGVRARIVPVGASLIDDVVAQVKNPPVPTFMNEQKGREEENPNDPAYLQALEDTNRQRTMAAMEAMILFGIELIDPLPEDDSWFKKLKWLSKRGILDLTSYDLEDEFDIEFLYKRYVACGTDDLILLGQKAGLSGADIETASESFKS